MEFKKPAKSSEDHYDLLISRGLEISNKDRCLKYLNHVGYYRLSGYMYPFQLADGTHKFKPKTTFDFIVNHYLFDKKLRFLLLAVIERIEVSLRSSITNIYSIKYGPFWYQDKSLFNNSGLHEELLSYIKAYCNDTSELFIKSYYSKYDSPSLPPSWMIMETLTFGKLTSLYENLKDTEEKKQIASVYSTVVPLLESWLKSINYIRNCCAHHIRIWNKRIPIKPIIPRRKEKRFLEFIDEETDKKLYGVLCVIVYMTTQISPNSEVKKRLKLLFSEFNEVNIYYMGFHEKWKEEVFWN